MATKKKTYRRRGWAVDTSTYPCDATQPVEKRSVNYQGKKFVFEKNVPIPGGNPTLRYPLDELEMGESFAVKRTEHAKIAYALKKQRDRVRKRNEDKVYVMRQTEDLNYRVFRVK